MAFKRHPTDRVRTSEGEFAMKMIVAIVRPEKVEAIQDALSAVEVYLMTLSDVRGCGRQRGFKEQYRGTQGLIRLLSKVKFEIAVNDEFAEPAVKAIMKAAHSGNIGDGKIFVLPLEECYRIRTGESGGAAIGP
jgi:nitrogen regulatory protein P-II 1